MALSIVRRRVRQLLESTPAFRALPPDQRKQIAHDTVRAATYMADPRGLVSQEVVDFPSFVAALVHGVFDAIVDASIQQMEAYAALMRDVSASVDDFMVDAISDETARDALGNEFPELFCRLQTKAGRSRLVWCSDAAPAARRRLKAALGLRKIGPDLDDVVAAARRRLARNRQQALATATLMGINRIVVTDGRIAPKLSFVPASSA